MEKRMTMGDYAAMERRRVLDFYVKRATRPSTYSYESNGDDQDDNNWRWNDNSNNNDGYDENVYESPYFQDENYESSDLGYYNYYSSPQQDQCNGSWRNDDFEQDPYYESSHSSKDEQVGEMLSYFENKLNQMLEMMEENYEQAESNNDRILAMEMTLQKMNEQLQEEEYFDSIIHEPTPLVFEQEVEDYVSSEDESKLEVIIKEEVENDLENMEQMFCESETTFEKSLDTINQENCDFDSETSRLILHEPEKLQVGKVATYPTTLTNPTEQVVFNSVRMDRDKKTQTYVIINQPFFTKTYFKISCQERVIDITFNDELRLCLFENINKPPTMDELIVINTIDDYVNKLNANMLCDNIHSQEEFLFDCRKGMKSKEDEQVRDVVQGTIHEFQMNSFRKLKRKENNRFLRKMLSIIASKLKQPLNRFKNKWLGPGDMSEHLCNCKPSVNLLEHRPAI